MTAYLHEPWICSFSRSLENALPDDGNSPEAALQATQRSQLLTAALGSLTTLQRAVVLMRYRDGQTWREIGIAFNVTPVAACRTGARAIAALKRWLEAHDISSIQSL